MLTSGDEKFEVPVRVSLSQPNRKLQPTEIKTLVTAYRAGTSIKQLGRQLGVHEQTVRGQLVRAGVTVRPARAMTPKQVIEVTELYLAGASLRQLGLKYDVPGSTIRNYLVRADVPLRPARRLPGQAASDAD